MVLKRENYFKSGKRHACALNHTPSSYVTPTLHLHYQNFMLINFILIITF